MTGKPQPAAEAGHARGQRARCRQHRRHAGRVVHRALATFVAVNVRAEYDPLIRTARQIEQQRARLRRPLGRLDRQRWA